MPTGGAELYADNTINAQTGHRVGQGQKFLNKWPRKMPKTVEKHPIRNSFSLCRKERHIWLHLNNVPFERSK